MKRKDVVLAGVRRLATVGVAVISFAAVFGGVLHRFAWPRGYAALGRCPPGLRRGGIAGGASQGVAPSRPTLFSPLARNDSTTRTQSRDNSISTNPNQPGPGVPGAALPVPSLPGPSVSKTKPMFC